MNTKKLFSGATSLLVAFALLVGGTMAFFTSSDTSEGNTLAAGTLQIDLVEDFFASLPFDVSGMTPGDDPVSECAAIENTGSLDFNWTLMGELTGGSDPNLANVLWATTYKWNDPSEDPTACDDDARWETIGGAFATLPVSAVLGIESPQGLLESGESVFYKFEYFLPEELTTHPGSVPVPDQNDYQGASTEFSIVVNAYQTNDPAYPGSP